MMKASVRRALASLLVISSAIALECVVVPSAWAGPDGEELSRARAKFQQATEMEQAGNYSGALQLFREVGQVRMTPQVRYHIALCEENLGKLVAALGGYELALAESEALGPEFQAEVQQRASDLRNRIPKLVIERGDGAEAATIELDGVSLGSSSIGAEVPVDPGPHLVIARGPGMTDFRETIDVPESETKRVTVTLERAETQTTEPITPGDAERPPPPPPSKPNRMIPYAIGAGGGVALIISGIFYAMQSSKDSDLQDLCGSDHNCRNDNLSPSQQQKAYNMNENLRTYATVTQVSLVAGVVGVGVAGVLLLTEPKPANPPANSGWRFNPYAAGADLAGASLVHSF